MRDMANNVQAKLVLSPDSVTDDTPAVGEVIDRLGYDSLTYIIAIGTVVEGAVEFVALLEESDAADMSGANAVDDADMISQTDDVAPETAASFDASDEVRKLGYIGNKRFTRLTITPTGDYATAQVSAVALLGHPHTAPVTQASA